MNHEVRLVRVLVWMLAAAVVVDAAVTKIAYGTVPGYLVGGLAALVGGLVATRPTENDS